LTQESAQCLNIFLPMKLTNTQEQVLRLLGQSVLAKKFYWTGGTLLAYHYLHHRHSVDLDFFTSEQFSFDEINEFVQQVKDAARFTTVSSKKIFDRYEFLFEKSEETLRIEFVYYNGHRKTLQERTEKLFGVLIDSLDDLAANKTLAYFDRTEPKDLFDLYFLLTQKSFSVQKLLAMVQKKFGATFTESLFWSESFKHLPLLETVTPLIEKKEIIQQIEEYFKKCSDAFLRKTLE